MAWAEKLPSGKYRGVYRDAHGVRRSAGTHTHKARAERAAAAKEEHARNAMQRDPEAFKRPWGDWCDEWWPTRQVAASTLRNDAARRRNHLDPTWATVPVGSITRQAVKAWCARLAREGLGAESVRRAAHLFSGSLGAAVDAEIIDANPAARLSLPKGALEQWRFLEREEYDALRVQLGTTGDQFIADMLVNTGLRWGELAGLHRSRVDLRRSVVRVHETYDESAGEMRPYPKGKRIREVPLKAELRDWIGDLSWSRTDCGVEHPQGRCPGALLVTTEEGTPLRNSNWSYRVWTPAVEHSGIGHVRIHDLRHTYASWLLQAGVPLAEVGRLLGHVSTQTTARYAHLAETRHDEVLAALEAPRKPHDSTSPVGIHAQGR